MIGRREFGLAGVSALALAALDGRVRAQDVQQDKVRKVGQDQDHAGHKAKMFEECAAACSDCQRSCDSCAAHCARLMQHGHKEHASILATCQDCGDICSAAARIVARGGPFSTLVCRACADACARCAKECDKFPDDKHMTACAAECRKCEKACKEMLDHPAQGNTRENK
jgi:hypothetical protein